jgi:hypothetical protein
MLGRWALGGEPPPRWVSRAAKYHVHSWQDRTWQWALAVPSALTDDELRQVVASIPAQEPGR